VLVTYSIVARDRDSGALGIGVASHFFSVGSIATFAEAGVGAVCSQAFAARQYGPLGLDLLRAGQPAPAVLEALQRVDPHPEIRQVGVVDAAGRAGAFTGDRCAGFAGHRIGDGVTAQGNMLGSDEVWGAMIDAFEKTSGDLAERLLAGLDAAEDAGGDARGRQSAHLIVVAGERTAAPWNQVLVDVRVEDHPEPLTELRRLVDMQRGYRLIGSVLFDASPLFQDPGEVDPGVLDEALAALADAQTIIGANPEPTMWRAILLAQAGRVDEAAAAAGPLLAATPGLAGFLRNLPAAGYLSLSAVEQMVQAVPEVRP
jgi:uncharacterized Ntn-hydrolase superfamily protein